MIDKKKQYWPTGLYSEEAYTAVSLCKRMRYSSVQAYSLSRHKVFNLKKTRTTRIGADWQVLRAPDGEVIAAHMDEMLFAGDTPRVMKMEIKAAITELEAAGFTEEEPFLVLVPCMHISTGSSVSQEMAEHHVESMCTAAVKGMTAPRAFLYEHTDVDWIMKNPLTTKKLRGCMEGLCKREGMIDPIATEQRRFLMQQITELPRWLEEDYPSIVGKRSFTTWRCVSAVLSTCCISVKAFKHAVDAAVSLRSALLLIADEQVEKSIEDFIEKRSYFGVVESYKGDIEEVAAELAQLLQSPQVQGFKEACRRRRESSSRFPSPALLADRWMQKAYSGVLS